MMTFWLEKSFYFVSELIIKDTIGSGIGSGTILLIDLAKLHRLYRKITYVTHDKAIDKKLVAFMHTSQQKSQLHYH